MKKHVFKIVFTILFIGILLFQYNENYSFRIQPPSEKWAKEVGVGPIDGRIRTYPRMLKYDDNSFLIAYQNGKNINIEKFDLKGSKLEEITIEVGDDFIRHLSFVGNAEKSTIYWITSVNGVKTLYNVEFDRNLKVIKRNQESNVNECTQIGDNTLLVTYKDRIEIKDISSNSTVINNIANASLVTGTSTKKGNLITFHENGKYFKYFYVDKGILSPTYMILAFTPDAKGGYFDRTVVASDNKNAYLLIEAKSGEDRYGTVKCLTFSLDGNEHSLEDLRVGGSKAIFGTVSASSGEEARFISSGTRNYERNSSQEDIFEFYIKDGKVVEYNYVSRTNQPSVYPAVLDNNLIFFNYIDLTHYDMFITSSSNEFKELHNPVRSVEKERALKDTGMGIVYSLVFIFLVGVKWMLFGITAVSGFSYLSHGMSVKLRKILYILSYGVLAIIKLSTINSFYGRAEFPPILNSSITATVICVVISLISFAYGYGIYRKDTDVLPLWSYIRAMMIDTLLTQLIFVPFIY